MARKSSTFVQATRERETWLEPAAEREGADEKERGRLLATAALIRGVSEAIPVPEEAEERSRAVAVAQLQDSQLNRGQSQVQAPWYLRLGRFMQFVFTLGRRR